MGRADNVMVYEGFTRSVSLDITLIAMSVEELHPMWQRINYLIGLTKPDTLKRYQLIQWHLMPHVL